MIDTSESAARFADVVVETFARCGVTVGARVSEDEFVLGEDDIIVLLGVVGAWRGAVAFRFDPGGVAGTAEAMAGEPVDEDIVRYEALLEAVNVVAGRGAARLAEESDGAAVWLTPPLLARGRSLQLRLQNLAGNCFRYDLGDGTGGILFSAAPAMGGEL